MASTRTLQRGLDVLESLSRYSDGIKAADVAAEVGLDRATTLRLLATLLEAGYVIKDPSLLTYRLTAKILGLSRTVGMQLDLRGLARPHLKALSEAVGETVHLGVLETDHVVYIDKIEPAVQSVRIVTSVGQSMPVHSTALGKAILSRMSIDDRRLAMTHVSLTAQTAHTIIDPREFESAIQTAATSGFAEDREENLEGAICVAAAVMGADHRPLAAISVSSPKFRAVDRVEALGLAVRHTAEQISADLGA